MKIFKSIIAIVCVFAICFSIVSVSFAAVEVGGKLPVDSSRLIRDGDSVSAWNSWYDNNKTGWLKWWVEKFGGNILWNYFDDILSRMGCGSCSSQVSLISAANYWSVYTDDFLSKLFVGASTNFDAWLFQIEFAYDSVLGVYRLREMHSGLWIVNSSGHFPYYRPPTDESGNVPAVDTTGVKWLPYKDAFQNQNNRHFVTKDVLDDMSDYYNGVVIKSDKYYVITTTDPITGGYLYLCDPHGYPYVNVIDPESTAVNTPNNYYDSTGSTTNNQLLIDLITNTIWFPDGSIQIGDQVIHNEETNKYYVDSHDTYTFNITEDSYNTTYYKWEYNYYIDYTSITYIGTSEEYQDPYECYYELPDGRSSADLTAEELEQLSLAFVDVINYARSADDIDMRVLYHFDGNTEDSSYWSYCTSFDWVDGASLTYMDEGTFNGSLYLDETDHQFVINLPSVDMAGDFTFQFRYYQSYTADPQVDSKITFGTFDVMLLTGGAYYDINTDIICDTAIGNWNEICFVREGSILSYYVNGVCYQQVVLTGSLGNQITFTFGSEQQTYKKLDEMRFTKRALYTGGEDYVCTAVPFDTNLALILPDGEVPIADEYFVINSPEDNVFASVDFSNLSQLGVREYDFSDFPQSADKTDVLNWYNSVFGFETFGLYMFGDTVDLTQGEGCINISVEDPTVMSRKQRLYEHTYSVLNGYVSFFDYLLPDNCLSICLSVPGSFGSTSGKTAYSVLYPEDGAEFLTYTLTLVDSAGNESSVTFRAKLSSQNVTYEVLSLRESTFTFSMLGIKDFSSIYTMSGVRYSTGAYGKAGAPTPYNFYGPQFLNIIPIDGKADIAYMELVQGSESKYTMSWHNAVYSSGQLEDSPVLAVKTTSKISSWQFGGVRPSYPEKGQVYGLVENGRITSLQLYTGYAWIAVDGRVWTGERWIPPSSFNVFTLQDFWDMSGTTDKDDYTYIYTESGFWDWWQKQWTKFTGTLFDKMDSSSGTDVTVNIQNDILLEEEDKQKFDEHEYVGIVKTLRSIYDFVAEFFTDFTMGGIQDFLGVLNDKNSFIYGIFKLDRLG